MTKGTTCLPIPFILILCIFRFTETETYSELFSLHIEIMDPDCNVVKLGPQTLEVPEFYGLSNMLDGNVMSFHYEHRPNIECTVRVTTLESGLPGHGQLVIGEPNKLEGPRGDEPDSFVSIRQQLGMTSLNVSNANMQRSKYAQSSSWLN